MPIPETGVPAGMGGEGGGEEKSLSLISESITHTLSHSLFFLSRLFQTTIVVHLLQSRF